MDLRTALDQTIYKHKGQPVPFAISFFTLKGKHVVLDEAVRRKTSKKLKSEKYITVSVPDNEGHDIPVHIHLIETINGQRVN